jgi:hypothetical protein
VAPVQPRRLHSADEELRPASKHAPTLSEIVGRGVPPFSGHAHRSAGCRRRVQAHAHPLVSLPAFAMLRMPGPVCLRSKFSSCKAMPPSSTAPAQCRTTETITMPEHFAHAPGCGRTQEWLMLSIEVVMLPKVKASRHCRCPTKSHTDAALGLTDHALLTSMHRQRPCSTWCQMVSSTRYTSGAHLELLAVDALAACAIASREVAALRHSGRGSTLLATWCDKHPVVQHTRYRPPSMQPVRLQPSCRTTVAGNHRSASDSWTWQPCC